MRRTLLQLAGIAAAVMAVSFGVLLINQTAQIVELAGRLHPTAGQAAMWALIFFYAACVAAPIVLWARLPRSLIPPASAEGPAFDQHLADLAARLGANPTLRRLAPEEAAPRGREQIEAALARLDREADRITVTAAQRVFLSTAVSQNGSLDALLVLGLQSRLVWDIARVYRQRPSLRDLGWLYGNVVTTAFVAGELEDIDLSEQIQPVIQSALGAVAGAVPGLQAAGTVVTTAILSGTANAFLTLRVGVVARRYCGALVRPGKRGLRRAAFAEAATMLGAVAASGARQVGAAVAKASGKVVSGAVTGLGSKVRKAGGSVVKTLSFRGLDGDVKQPTAGAVKQPTAGDVKEPTPQ